MNPDSEQAKWIMRYLLGELSEEEQSRLEETYFTDPALFQDVRASRDDLIDAYLRGELSPEQHERFENYFMATSRRRERVEFARNLVRTVDQTQEPAKQTSATPQVGLWRSVLILLNPYRRPIIAMGILLLVLAGGWFLIRSQRERSVAENPERASHPPSQVSPKAVETPVASPNETNSMMGERPVNPPLAPSPKLEPKMATFALSTGLLRDSAETKILAIPKTVERVQLSLEVERNDVPRYRAVLRTPEGQELWSAQVKNPRSKPDNTIVIRLPASIFKNADYILSLSALNNENKASDVGKYYFRVDRK